MTSLPRSPYRAAIDSKYIAWAYGADKAARQHFNALSRDEKRQAICRLADTGYSDYLIATATKLSVEMIRQILAKLE